MASRVLDVLQAARDNLGWLEAKVPALFAGTLREDHAAIAALATGLGLLQGDRQILLADRARELVVARLDTPGSIFQTLRRLEDRDVSRAEIFHSREPVPGGGYGLEIQHYVFDRKPGGLVRQAGEPAIPAAVRGAVLDALAAQQAPIAEASRGEVLRLLWLNDPKYVEAAAPREVAQLLRLLHEAQAASSGFFLSVEPASGPDVEPNEVKLLFAIENPPTRYHLTQLFEVFDVLNVGVRRSLSMTVSTTDHPYFLGVFHVAHRRGGRLDPGTELFGKLRALLYNTQILATESAAYWELVLKRVMTGEEAALVNALIGFCHTTCAHAQPHRYTHEDVVRAFLSHPDVALRLVHLFRTRFDPDLADREVRWSAELAEVEHEVAAYNTGHRQLDEFRRSIFQVALVFVKRTLKTNFFVPEKHALAFRLDPRYLDDLDPAFTADLPPERPFRVTFFFGRGGLGYHVGFADIARGGWRTIFARTRDDYVTVANTLFRENYVLAHTQHLKNKDIYEGGSKMVCVLHAPDVETRGGLDERLHRLQWKFANAFLDLFVTEGGRPKDPRVVDYYGEDEPIELGPDENMHDEMIEAIADLAVKRGYVLGRGIMSSKRVGINHKQYGVTSLGVVTFAEIAMQELGVDIRKDAFRLKMTGGPNGDVAGNGLRLLLERCPRVSVQLIVDGTAAIVDPAGIDRAALSRIVLRGDADAFDPGALSVGGFVLYRNSRRTEGLRELYRRVERTDAGLHEDWRTVDEFHKEFDELLFRVPADLFIPAGGRPETIDGTNWRRFLLPDGTPSARVIVEGANSFVTPEARNQLQAAGAVVLRDASANKCGVMSSSYEIIANLLFDDAEFLEHKEAYVADVLEILERRAADEARLIMRRHREGKGSFTEISNAVSREINANKARLFAFFESRRDLVETPAYRRALLAHLPRMVGASPRWSARIARLPPKYRSAILAAELGAAMVYRAPLEPDFAAALEQYVGKTYA